MSVVTLIFGLLRGPNPETRILVYSGELAIFKFLKQFICSFPLAIIGAWVSYYVLYYIVPHFLVDLDFNIKIFIIFASHDIYNLFSNLYRTIKSHAWKILLNYLDGSHKMKSEGLLKG